MRTGNRRSASTIISFELAAIVFLIRSHGGSHRPFAVSSRLGLRSGGAMFGPMWPRPPLLRYQRDQACLLDPAASAHTHHLDEVVPSPISLCRTDGCGAKGGVNERLESRAPRAGHGYGVGAVVPSRHRCCQLDPAAVVIKLPDQINWKENTTAG